MLAVINKDENMQLNELMDVFNIFNTVQNTRDMYITVITHNILWMSLKIQRKKFVRTMNPDTIATKISNQKNLR